MLNDDRVFPVGVFLKDRPGSVAGAIVNQHELLGLPVDLADLGEDGREQFLFVINRYDYGKSGVAHGLAGLLPGGEEAGGL